MQTSLFEILFLFERFYWVQKGRGGWSQRDQKKKNRRKIGTGERDARITKERSMSKFKVFW